MTRKLFGIILITGIIFSATGVLAGSAAKMASEAYEPFDPKKKKPGEECKTSDECQRHHSCNKEGDKNVCVAPPPRKLPPGVVT